MSKSRAKGTSVAKTEMTSESAGQEKTITAEERYRMIAEAAYYHAEKRGFVGGDAAEDWLQAESEIERYLQKTPASPASKTAPAPSSSRA